MEERWQRRRTCSRYRLTSPNTRSVDAARMPAILLKQSLVAQSDSVGLRCIDEHRLIRYVIRYSLEPTERHQDARFLSESNISLKPTTHTVCACTPITRSLAGRGFLSMAQSGRVGAPAVRGAVRNVQGPADECGVVNRRDLLLACDKLLSVSICRDS